MFPLDLPPTQHVQFESEGFQQPVCGVIYTRETPVCCGLPIGGISTGSLDIETSGAFGFCTIFSPFIKAKIPPDKSWWYVSPFEQRENDPPAKEGALPWCLADPGAKEKSGTNEELLRQLILSRLDSHYPQEANSPKSFAPFLGMSIGRETWVLASPEVCSRGWIGDTCEDKNQVFIPRRIQEIPGVRTAHQIQYWGHYPIADLEFETSSPVKAALRAWAPFLPGDTPASTTPVGFFDVHLRNTTDNPVEIRLAFSFPGPTQGEAQFFPDSSDTEIVWHVGNGPIRVPRADRTMTAKRNLWRETGISGVTVSATSGMSYSLAVLSGEPVEFGRDLKSADWQFLPDAIPRAASPEFGSSIVITVQLAPLENKLVPIILSWYQPCWYGTHPHQVYVQKYTERFADAADVALSSSRNRVDWLARIIAWQSVIYGEESLPSWLSDVLINSLSTIPESSFWSRAVNSLAWMDEDGYFMQVESLRRAAAPATAPCDLYGNWPIVFFYEDLARNQLKIYGKGIGQDGSAPLALGLDAIQPGDFSHRDSVHAAVNGICYVSLVDRLWQRTGDRALLEAHYKNIKANTLLTMTRPDGGLCSVAEGPNRDGGGEEWWEATQFFGYTAHVGGLHLAQLAIVERMAHEMGDSEFEQECHALHVKGLALMEKHLWNGKYYRNYNDPASGKSSDLVMASQLDGEWLGKIHGVEVFPQDNVGKTLDTVFQLCRDSNTGALSFVTPDGQPTGVPTDYIFTPETNMLGMTYLYSNRTQEGLEILHDNWFDLVCRHRYPWDLPNTVLPGSGQRGMGTEYYQNLVVWTVPAAVWKTDIRNYCSEDGFVTRILRAARGR